MAPQRDSRSAFQPSAAPILTLNDLFVGQAARRLGVGKALLTAAADYGKANGAVRLSPRTI